jgi:hypothetical protein
LVGRCLRKDLARRAQHASDVKVALNPIAWEPLKKVLGKLWFRLIYKRSRGTSATSDDAAGASLLYRLHGRPSARL